MSKKGKKKNFVQLIVSVSAEASLQFYIKQHQ